MLNVAVPTATITSSMVPSASATNLRCSIPSPLGHDESARHTLSSLTSDGLPRGSFAQTVVIAQ